MNTVVRFGVGARARRAAMKYADQMWESGTPARAVFKVELGGWAVIVYPSRK